MRRADETPPAHDPNRLRRAAQRGVQQLGPRQFRVEGRHERFYDVNLDADLPCDCADAQYRGRRSGACLHLLAARLHAGDNQLIMSLGQMLLRSERIMQEALRRTRRKRTGRARPAEPIDG